jgi:hypothetical protein
MDALRIDLALLDPKQGNREEIFTNNPDFIISSLQKGFCYAENSLISWKINTETYRKYTVFLHVKI